MRNHLHQHWAATGPLVETEPSQHVQAQEAWLSARCGERQMEPAQVQVLTRRLIRRQGFGIIRRALGLRYGEAEVLYRRGMESLQAVPGFWDPAGRFERDIVPCAENKDDFDERPEGVRGVTPDRSSDRFQGARLVARDDRRLRQDPESAARLWVQCRGRIAVP
jgi:hypothetical protein